MKTLIPLLVCGLLAITFGVPTGPSPATIPSASPPTGHAYIPGGSLPPMPTYSPDQIPLEGCSEMEIQANFELLFPAVMHVFERSSEKGKKFYESKLDIFCDDDDEEEEDDHKAYMALMKDMSQLPHEIIDSINFDDDDIQGSVTNAVRKGLNCSKSSCEGDDCSIEVAWEIMHTLEKYRLACRTCVAQRIVLAILMRATETIVVDDSHLPPSVQNRNRTIEVLVKTAKVLSKRIRRTFLRPQRTTFQSLTSALARAIHAIIEENGADVDSIINGVKGPITRSFQCVPEGAMTRRTLWAIEELEDLIMAPAQEIVFQLLPRFLPPCAAIEHLVGISDPIIAELTDAVTSGIQRYQQIMYYAFWYLEQVLLSGDPSPLQKGVSKFLNANETALFNDAILGWNPIRCS